MFGWINDCTESLVVTKFGLDKWHEIKKKAENTTKDGGFIRHQYYSDASTVELVVAASEVLNVSVDDVLEAFGTHFMEFTRGNGYDNMLSCQGSNLRLWLSNLNALHDHLQSSLPEGFAAPVFWCENDESEDHVGSILFHYYSKRGNLFVALVVGVVKEVARYHFDLDVKLERLQMQDVEDAKFTTWRISTENPDLQWKLTSSTRAESLESERNENGSIEENLTTCPFRAMSEKMKNTSIDDKGMGTLLDAFKKGEKKPEESNVVSSRSGKDSPFHAVSSIDDKSMGTLLDAFKKGEKKTEESNHDGLNVVSSSSGKDSLKQSICITGDNMQEVFPYHIVVDASFQILQCGRNLQNLTGDTFLITRHIQDVLKIDRPVLGSWDWPVLHRLEDQTFFLRSVRNEETKLKANIIRLSNDPKLVMFNISPDVKNVTELSKMNLTMSDLPLHSFQRDAVFLGEHMYSEVRSAFKLDRLAKKLENEKNLSNTLLYSMLPQNVADLLRRGETYEPMSHDDVTLFFSDVVGFTEMAAELAPWEVVDMLNILYTVMDFLSEKFGLYKVETIGDAYMCCSGLPELDEFNAENVANFAIAVNECVKLVKSPITGESIRLRMGIHSGHCMSGVVGTLTPHYCLFGDMVNTTSRHESTGEPGRIQASSITYGKISHFSEQSGHFRWTPRGLVTMKGKGRMFTYWLDGASELNPQTGPEALKKLVEEVEVEINSNKWKKRNYFLKRAGSIASGITDFASGSVASGNTEFAGENDQEWS